MAGIPPHSPAVLVPAAGGDEVKRALGVKEPTALVGGLVGVEEREPLPAVVVEERLNISCTVSRVRGVAAKRTVPVALVRTRETVYERLVRR